uniref:Uncharacterized protein n=1 Tax=Anguilla anguilla TaxID=7936 RepID=A0A0E9QH77_ANGAN
MCSHSVYVCMCNGGVSGKKTRAYLHEYNNLFQGNFISDLSACLNVHIF